MVETAFGVTTRMMVLSAEFPISIAICLPGCVHFSRGVFHHQADVGKSYHIYNNEKVFWTSWAEKARPITIQMVFVLRAIPLITFFSFYSGRTHLHYQTLHKPPGVPTHCQQGRPPSGIPHHPPRTERHPPKHCIFTYSW